MKQTKKRWAALICVLLLLLGILPQSVSAETAGPVIRAVSTSAPQGGTVTVTIRGENLDALRTLHMTLYYDSTVLTPTKKLG